MPDDYQLHVIARGRVQGVFFRAFAREKATAAGLSGWAKNTADGHVDILLAGDRDSVLAVREQLREGPPNARVTALDCEEVYWPIQRGFYTA